MKQFDELSIAEKMNDTQSFPNGYTRTDLCVYAKWLKYKAATSEGIDYKTISGDQLRKYDTVVEKQLIEFCMNNCGGWNYATKYNDIDFAITASNQYKLKLPLPLPITQSEIDAIKTVENENYRRMLFVMLVDAKYYRFNTTKVDDVQPIDEDTVFYCKLTRSEIKTVSKITYDSPSEKKFFLNCIYTKGLFDMSESKLRTWYIKFIDIKNENVVDYITDYDHIMLHYEKIFGGRIGRCETCGVLFRQSKFKNSDFCCKHRGRKRKEYDKQKICVECGSIFDVTSRTRRDTCDSCYKKIRYKKMEECRKNKRNENN